MKKLMLAVLLLCTITMGCTWRENNVIDHTMASIVRITGIRTVHMFMGSFKQSYVCTGFVVAPETILTANHCLGDNMLADGEPITIVNADKYYDLGLLIGKTKRPVLSFRETPVTRSETLIGVGYGFGWTKPFGTRQVVVLPSVAVSPEESVGIVMQGGGAAGMSGGPIVDLDGLVVSVNQQNNMGFGFGVAEPMIKAFLLDAGVTINVSSIMSD